MNKKLLIIIAVFLISFYPALAVIDMLSFEASLFDSSGDPINGNITIEIYDAETAGNLIYNSSNDFIDNITSGKVDITLGGSRAATELNLTYGTTYYMDINVNGNDIDFNGLERQEFQSQIGNITEARLNLTGTLSVHSLEPAADQTFDLGSASRYFNNIYINTLNLLTRITNSQIASNAINTTQIIDGTITEDDIAAANLTDTVIADIYVKNTGDDITGDLTIGGGYQLGGITLKTDGDLFINGTLFIIENITNVDVVNLNVNGSFIPSFDQLFDLGSSSFYWNNLYVGTLNLLTRITNSQIASNAINTTQIIDRTITADDLADSSVNSTLILDRTITADDLADSSVNVTHVGDIFLLNTGDSASGDYNFDSNTLFIDSASDLVGIRTSTPANALNVIGDANFTGTLTVGGQEITPESNVSGGGTAGYIVKFVTANTIGNSIIEEEAEKIAIGTGTRTPTQLLTVFGDINATTNLSTDDSILADYIYSNANTFTRINNVTITNDLRVLGNSYLGSFTLEDDLIIGNNNLSSTYLGIATKSPSAFLDVQGNISAEGSLAVAAGTLFVNNETDRIGIKTLSPDDVLHIVSGNIKLDDDQTIGWAPAGTTPGTTITGNHGSEYIRLATASGNILNVNTNNVGINTISPTATLDVYSGNINFSRAGKEGFFFDTNNERLGISTGSPLFPIHIIINDTNNETITELLALEHINSSGDIGDGIGSSILFRTVDDRGEIENISMISGILEDVSNGTERGSLVFYTGYGDANGIISNLSSAEAARLSANGTLTLQNDLRVLGNSYLGSLTFTDNGTFPDSILTDFIYAEANPDTSIDNATILKDLHILGTLYGGSPLLISGSANLSGNLTLTDDSILADYIYPYGNAVIRIENLSVNQDIFTAGNISSADSVNVDYLFPKSASFTRIDNVTIYKDLRVLGSSYLGSFVIKDDLSVGQTNITSTNTGIGTLAPDFLLHLNLSDSANTTFTELLVLEKTTTGVPADNLGSAILFKAEDDAREVENISMIAGILSDVSNGTERADLVFYTGYGDANGIISNLSSAEAMRISSEGNVSITNNLAVKNSLGVTSDLNVDGLCVAEDSLITLASGEKKMIKDIKAGEEVLSLNEETGKLVPNKVKALLDMGFKPIYELTLESGKSVNTTATHPYLVKINSKEKCEEYSGNIWNKNNPESYDNENYCLRWVSVKELKEGMEIAAQKENQSPFLFLNSPHNRLNLTLNSLNLVSILNNSANTPPNNISVTGGDPITPNNFNMITNNANRINPQAIIPNTLSIISLFIYSPLDLPIDNPAAIPKIIPANKLKTRSSFSNKLNNEVIVTNTTDPTAMVLYSPDSINSSYQNSYLNLLKEADFTFEKITSINILEAQHVYDLALEGFSGDGNRKGEGFSGEGANEVGGGKLKKGRASSGHNFIANDIIAHNTYLSGNVSLNDNFTVDGSTFYVDASSNRVGIGTTSPSSLLDIFGGNLTITNSSTDFVYFKFSIGGYAYDNGTALIFGH